MKSNEMTYDENMLDLCMKYNMNLQLIHLLGTRFSFFWFIG